MQWWGDETGFYPLGGFQTNSFVINKNNKLISSIEQEH